MTLLPVSRIEVVLRQPDGADDLLLVESAGTDTRLALALVSRVASTVSGDGIDCESLAVTDLDALLLSLRRLVFGDLIRADARCPVEGCGARMDIAFGVTDYLAHHAPRRAHGVGHADENGWFRLPKSDVLFRLPTVKDLLAVEDDPKPERELRRRCVRPASFSKLFTPRVERAMRALAPSLAEEIRGECPECGAQVDIHFDPRAFVLRELRGQASYVYVDVHLIAARYHWRESDILALPRSRRVNYAEMIRREMSPD